MQHDKSNPDVEVLEGELPDASETIWHDAAAEIFKRNVPFLNEILRQFVTASIALAGGGMYFLSAEICGRPFKLAGCAMFLLALLCSMVGVMPYRDDVCLSDFEAVRDNLRRAIHWKVAWIWAAMVFVVLGLATVFMGSMAR